MKRLLLGVTILGAAAFLGGCPIYSNSSSTPYGEYQVCNDSGCYSCPDSSYSSACVPWPCRGGYDCAPGYACSSDYGGSCIPAAEDAGPPTTGTCSVPSDCASGYTCGQDGTCHQGDCGQAGVGCPDGFVCKLAGGQAQCVVAGQPGDDGGPTEDSAPPSEAGPTPDSSTSDSSSGDDASAADGSDSSSSDSSTPPDTGVPVVPCNADSDCSGSGGRCVDGQCTPQTDLCSDTSQCRVAGEACVDGLCEPHCDTASPCPTGYSCDLTRGVCNINPSACTATASCQGGTVCVEQHCVPPCAASEGGAACPGGQVCVNGGCIPDQAAVFACTNDGQSGSTANLCPSDGICVHHDCYTACTPGDGGSGCSGSAICQPVTIETGSYAVCAKPSTLGSDCDPAQAKLCAAGTVCIDGYCR